MQSIDMAPIKVYSSGNCLFCMKAKSMLEKWKIDYEETRIDLDQTAMREFVEATNGARTVPQILVEGKLIGGYTDLVDLHMDGELDHLMSA